MGFADCKSPFSSYLFGGTADIHTIKHVDGREGDGLPEKQLYAHIKKGGI